MEAGDGEVAVPVVEDAVATYQQSVEAAFDENDGEDLVPVLSSVLQQLVHRDDKVRVPIIPIKSTPTAYTHQTGSGSPARRWHTGRRSQSSTR
jgi:hypothetical protein